MENLAKPSDNPMQSSEIPSSNLSVSSVINTQPPPNTSKFHLPADAVNMELRRKLWDGLLPVKIDLAISDLILHGKTQEFICKFPCLIQIPLPDHGSTRELLFLLVIRSEIII